MELLNVARILMRHRWLVLLGAALSVVAGVAAAMTHRSSAAPGGGPVEVRLQLQVDMPEPLVLDLHAGLDAIGTQAALLGGSLAEGTQLDAIAQAAGVSPRRLEIVLPAPERPAVPSPLATRAADAAEVATADHVLTVRASATVPIVSLSATAPDEAAATRLVEAAGDRLAALAAERAWSPSRGLDVAPLGEPRVIQPPVPGKARALLPFAVPVILFCGWCMTLVIVTGAVARLRCRAIASAA